MRDPFDDDSRRRREEAARRLRRLYERLEPADLAAGASWSLDSPQTGLFLGTYSEQGIHRVIEHYGLGALLAERGIRSFTVEIDTSDPFLHALRLREPGGEVFVDLRVRLALGRDLPLPGRLAEVACFVIEWLSIENPYACFSRTRPPLPGQRRPGLGVGPEVEEMLVLGARRVGASALIAWPQWFHNAWLYHPRWRFPDPHEEGRFAALVRDLRAFGLARIAWAVHLGCVRDAEGKVFDWRPGPLALPRTRAAARHFATPRFRALRLAARTRHAFALDEAALERALASRGLELP